MLRPATIVGFPSTRDQRHNCADQRPHGKSEQGEREAVRLLKLREMSLRQAAAVSGMTVAALKAAVHRALKNLRKMLARSGEEP